MGPELALRFVAMVVSHELAGAGPPVLLLHAGICDSRMWDPQWEAFAGRYQAVRLDFRGFGQTPLAPGRLCHGEDAIAVMDGHGLERAALVGASFGGRVALELAVARPDRVTALVLVCPGMPDHEWSDTVEAYGAEEEAAFERGDLDTAVEANLRMWVDGPHRAPDAVDPSVRTAVGEMQRCAFEHWLALPAQAREAVDEEALVPDLGDRLGEISAPTLILLGELDVDDMHAIAERLSRLIPGARFASIAQAAHLPSLERPDELNDAVLRFLDGAIEQP